MMTLASSALRAAATNMFSPSKNACMVTVTPTVTGARRYRNDPYRANVLAVSPSKVAPPTPEKAPRCEKKQPLQARTSAYQNHAVVAAAPAMPAMQPAARPVPTVAPAAHPLPNAPIAPTMYCAVQFKHTSATYRCDIGGVHVGDFVIVEGDRGINMGSVMSMTPTKPTFPVASKVIRLASLKEKESQSALRHKEAQTTRRILELAETHAPTMKIVDSEFQLDSNKLTIFFASKRLIDFRQLQRALFREFKCRVWLLNWNEVCPHKPLPTCH